MSGEAKELKYVSRKGIKSSYGWTDFLIKKFLGAPDKTMKNPYYRSAGDVQLWEIKKIEEIEKKPEFIIAREYAKTRQLIALSGVQTKKNKIMAYITALEIKLPDITQEELVRRACKSYNNHNMEKAQRYDDFYFEPVNKNAGETFLNRICINYLRHCCSIYESQLDKIFGKVGVDTAYIQLKNKVNQAIIEKYQFLTPLPGYSDIFNNRDFSHEQA